MQNLLKNKLFILLFIFFVILFFKENFVSASTTYTLSDGFTFTTSDDFDSLIKEKGKEDLFVLKASNGNSIAFFTYNSNVCELLINKSDNKLLCRIPGGTDWYYGLDYYLLNLDDMNEIESFSKQISDTQYISLSSIDRPYYAAQNIYYYTDEDGILYDELVFQGAPQGTQLAQIVEQAETEKTLAEIIAILPMILVIIVGLIGLRKALAFLQKLLRKS